MTLNVQFTYHAIKEIERLQRETHAALRIPATIQTRNISADFICLVYKLDRTYHLSDRSEGNRVVIVIDNKPQDDTFGNIVTVYLAHDYQVAHRARKGGHKGYSNYYQQMS